MRDGVVAAAGCAAVDIVGDLVDAAEIEYRVRTPIAVVSSTCLVLVEGLLGVSLVGLSRIDWNGPKSHLGERAKAFHDNRDNVEGRLVSLAA